MICTLRFLLAPCLFIVLLVTAGNIASAADGDQWSLGGDMQITSNPSPAISPSGDVNATWSYFCGANLCANPVSGDISGSVNLEMPDEGIGWNNSHGSHIGVIKFDTDANLVPDGDDKTIFETGQVGGHSPYSVVWTPNFNGEVTLDYLGYNAREQDGEWVLGHEKGRPTHLSVLHNGVELDSYSLAGGPDTGIENAYTGTATVQVVVGDEISIVQGGGEWCGIDLTVTVGEAIPPGPERGWTVDRSDSWHVDNHWSLRDAPDNNTNIAVFGDVISRSRVVVLEDDVTVQGAQFVNSNTYAIAGVGSLTLDAGEASAAAVDVLLGNHEFQAPVNLSSDTQATIANGATLTFNNALNLGGNTLTKIGPGTLEINNNVVTGGGTINCQGGNCSGTGTVGGDLINNSFVSPGSSAGGAAANAVPEPSSLLLLLSSCLALLVIRRQG